MPVPQVKLGDSIYPWSIDVQAFLEEVDGRLGLLEDPKSPSPAYACLKADLPAAADYINCVAYVTDTKILVASDGTVWRRQDTGAAI